MLKARIPLRIHGLLAQLAITVMLEAKSPTILSRSAQQVLSPREPTYTMEANANHAHQANTVQRVFLSPMVIAILGLTAQVAQ